MAQNRRTRGMAWTADSADLRRDRSFLATWERGSYVGSSWSASEEESDEGDEKNSSETLEALDDLCIFFYSS
ncbi:hypothetical protein SLA2020_380950 [Shorea laevis]